LLRRCQGHRRSTGKVKYLCEYSKKIEIVSRLAYWDQEKLLEEKTRGKKSGGTVPLNQKHLEIYQNPTYFFNVAELELIIKKKEMKTVLLLFDNLISHPKTNITKLIFHSKYIYRTISNKEMKTVYLLKESFTFDCVNNCVTILHMWAVNSLKH
jgi:hypothetical protein